MVMKRLLCLIIFITFCFPVFAEETDGKAYLKKGKDELEKGEYEDAVSSLSRAAKEFPILGDYALMWLSDAYRESGNHEESLKTIREFLKNYPHSPLLKKIRAGEIVEAEEISENNILPLFESYLKDYPSDMEMKYCYAQWLKKNGQEDKARSLLKDIYIAACQLSGAAYSELSPSDVSIEDMTKRASNLIKAMQYRTAESLLRSAMEKDDGSHRTEILKGLGKSLFSQKRYLEAAEFFGKAGERYWEVRSLFRAGENDTIDASMDGLLNSGDKKIGSVLVAFASDKRRDGKIEEALKIYQAVRERFPSKNEDTLWGIGWTHFLAGEYQKASENFDNLYSKYGEAKYLYWKARCLDADGHGDPGNYSGGKLDDFYSIMLYTRTQKGSTRVSDGNEDRKTVKPMNRLKMTPPAGKKIDRVEALIDLGFQKEAVAEMVYISKNTNCLEDMLYICSKFQELGEYNLSVKTAVRLPFAEKFHDFLYPLAYKDIVEGVSAKHSIDPFLVYSIVREESRFDSAARSSAGAIGLMQVMPRTASALDCKLKLGIKDSHDLVDVKKNLEVGIYYLSRLIKEFGAYPYAIAAYNAGDEIVKKWIQKGNYKSADVFIEDIPYAETRQYVKRVMTTFFKYKNASRAEGEMRGIPLGKL
jgi:soluble lytic murein transglycosylase